MMLSRRRFLQACGLVPVAAVLPATAADLVRQSPVLPETTLQRPRITVEHCYAVGTTEIVQVPYMQVLGAPHVFKGPEGQWST